MSEIAFVFAGQGAQYSGMGRSLYESCTGVRELYEAAEAYRPGTVAQSFFGTDEELKQTVNTQPCVFLADLAAAIALRENGIEAGYLAGFSLGELAALSFGGAFTYSEAFEIVCHRAEAMERASAEMRDEPAMAAVMKLCAGEVEELCRDIADVYPVNYNSPEQTVISGTKHGIEEFCKRAVGVRVVPIAVSGAFHTPFMQTASAELYAVLSRYETARPSVPVYADINGEVYPTDIRSCLAAQLWSPVRWQTCVENMIRDGADTFIECGAGKTLSGLIRRIARSMGKNVTICSVQDAESLSETVHALRGKA